MAECISCRRPKASFQCDICGEPVCKDCDQFLSEEAFPFLEKRHPELSHSHYCPSCHDQKVVPAQEAYDETLERAEEVYFFYATHKRPPTPLKRAQGAVHVKDCIDRHETILRLAFRAAEQGYNAVMDAKVESVKVRNGAYQTSLWNGSGVPALVDAEKLERRSGGYGKPGNWGDEE